MEQEFFEEGVLPVNLSPVRKNKKGQMVHSAQKLIIINLYKNMKVEYPNILKKDLIYNISEKTGIGHNTIKRTLLDYEKAGMIKSPNKKKMRLQLIDKFDEFDKNAIRRKVHSFYLNKEMPTLEKILITVNDDSQLTNVSKTSLYRLLLELDFKFCKRGRNSMIMEREDLISWRRRYIQSVAKYRNEGRTIYYLDETWLNAGDVSSKVWEDKTVKSAKDAFLRGLSTGASNPTGKGKRLIILHIGSKNGFVSGGLLCFESKKNSSDYHDEMNGETFKEWFQNTLPLLDENCVIVMDNAPYHSVKEEKIPNMSWKKENIKNWLLEKELVFEPWMVKLELIEIVNSVKNNFDKYVIDEIAKKSNRLVLRLPPYHCELNPIENVWSQIKRYVKTQNTTFKLPDVIKLLHEGIERVTPETWSNYVNHILKVESDFFQIDNNADDMFDDPLNFVFTVNTGETSSDDEFYEEGVEPLESHSDIEF